MSLPEQPRALSLLAALPLLAAACGCGEETARREPAPPPPRASAPGGEAAPANDDAAPTDAQIAEAIRFELSMDATVDHRRVEVAVDDGVAMLTGRAPQLRMVDAAVGRAEMVRGVVAVVERIEVDGAARDPQLQGAVQDALRVDATTEALELEVTTEEGVVTLAGTVDSYVELREAERVARAVSGVRDTVNEITVAAPDEARPDSELAADVRAALRADRWVDQWRLAVEVDDGVVYLRGVQPAVHSKRRAEHAAHVIGVREVDASELTVDPALAREMRRPPAGYAYPTDEEIFAWVERALEMDPRVQGERPVNVDVIDNVVVLRGVVADDEARAAAERSALSVHGVMRLENHLLIAGAPEVADAEADDEASRRPPAADHVLRERVVGRLRFSPYVDHRAVHVSVSAGVVTLEGTVADWRAHHVATQTAREAGARSVVNGLSIDASRAPTTP